jgi:hypothetical protein
MRGRLWLGVMTGWLLATFVAAAPSADKPRAAKHHPEQIFKTSDSCLACHNGLTTSSGEDISIGSDWRASMMANSSRDPYWQGSVRREVIDHPAAAEDIQDECSVCHMPMARAQAKTEGRKGNIFNHLPIGRSSAAADRLAADGVSCTMCHQITDRALGTAESFTGGFVLESSQGALPRAIFGPFQVDNGRTRIMMSATQFKPSEAPHIRQSELCATCHTLYTEALGRDGEVVGRLPEQMPYLEWRHSSFRSERSCQSCHMPEVEEDTRIASVLGDPRPGFSRHVFRGGNFFVLGMLNRYRDELGVEALPQELDASVHRTRQLLQTETAAISIERQEVSANRLLIDVAVRNLAGHKLPTGYPSRRVWLHVTVQDASNRCVFESGAMTKEGAIEGNDSDVNRARYEPHYREIRRPDEVQIYESVMGDLAGVPTTGLLTAVRFLKDNRLLPRGFEKSAAGSDIAVVGDAAEDVDFADGIDRVRYSIDVGGLEGPFRVEVELRYQPIAFRWAQNLKEYNAPESRRFVTYFEAMASASSEVLARAQATVMN